MKEFLVETDFLFGLSAKDKLHPYVMKLLSRCRRGEVRVVVSSAAPLEVMLVLLSRGFDVGTVARVLKLMSTKLTEYRVSTYAPITPEAAARASELRVKYRALTLFDSIHIAIASEVGLTLLTSDKTIAEVMEAEGLNHLEYRNL